VMERRNRAWYNNFDVILGIGVLAVVAAGVPWLGQQLDVAKNVRSRDHAARVAQAILDYHAEKGQWPAANGQPVDLTVVASAIAPAPTEGAMMAPGGKRTGDKRSAEVPVDSWGHPFVAAIYDEGVAEARPLSESLNESLNDSSSEALSTTRAYRMTPPAGATIVVVSPGRDGVLQTNLGALADVGTPVFLGDDTGEVLHGTGS
jgi:hypothetical protein